ncbi:MAG TPA: 6,7-dimethyl-8-ribityllumazine synthase [Dehalococcoidia bacterium]|jgi:6,7-dimethyl-8-ribityllumazine synthase|nr:6,7-dimethyl-8-ribityllumazine synthase [Dehalococcoidia bacterium]
MQVIPEDLDGSGLSIAVVVSRFNTLVTERLLAGALEALAECRVPEAGTVIAWVPGSFELAYAARQLALSGRFDAVICLGCVIKGETDHNEYINREAARGIAQVGEDTGVPAIFGVITPNNLEQALARVPEGPANKGYEVALSAVVMGNLRRSLRRAGLAR